LKEKQKAIIFIGQKFLFGILGNPKQLDLEELKKVLLSGNEKVEFKTKNSLEFQNPITKKKIKTTDVLQFAFVGEVKYETVQQFLTA